ncbi:MAG: hypothetical protein RL726_144 [Actinomycetota bacterium]
MSEDHPDNDEELDRLVDRADLDGLVRLIDARCASRDWDGLERVRTACRAATKTGRQVWPAATLAEYRTALLAPASHACRMLDEDSGRFTIGPLTEVIAQHHTWADLAAFLEPGPRRSFVAYERVLRGDRPIGEHESIDLPMIVLDWEPDYALPVYSDDGVRADCPTDDWRHDWTVVEASDHAEFVGADDIRLAVRNLVEPWTATSNGRAESVTVDGDVAEVLGALGLTSARVAEIDGRSALAWLAWCGASGGAHGRRRGGALGRFDTWWLLAALGGIQFEWDDLLAEGRLNDELGAIVESLRWYRFDDATTSGYELSLIVVDPLDGLAIGLSARDTA